MPSHKHAVVLWFMNFNMWKFSSYYYSYINLFGPQASGVYVRDRAEEWEEVEAKPSQVRGRKTDNGRWREREGAEKIVLHLLLFKLKIKNYNDI